MNPYPFTLGRYEIVRPLAEGGFGQVYLARILGEAGFHRTVAMKRIRPELTAATSFIDDFIKEARLGGYLQHHNVVQVLGFERLEGHYVLVMDFVDGIGLDAIIDLMRVNGTWLPPALVAEIGAQAADGLAYVHNLRGPEGQPLQLVHRDLKPSNLLISRAGMVKITDFGIARVALEVGERTQAGQIKGTVAYLSPEQARGEHLDARSDLYSFGAILYEMLALERLYMGDSTYAVLSAVGRNAGGEKLASLPPEAEPFLPVLERLVTVRPEERFDSAAEVAEALREIQRSLARPGESLAHTARLWAEQADKRKANYESLPTAVNETGEALSGVEAWRRSGTVWKSDPAEASKKTSLSAGLSDSTRADAGAQDFARLNSSITPTAAAGDSSRTMVRLQADLPSQTLVTSAAPAVSAQIPAPVPEPTSSTGPVPAPRSNTPVIVGAVVLAGLGALAVIFWPSPETTTVVVQQSAPPAQEAQAPAATPAPAPAAVQGEQLPPQAEPVQVASAPAAAGQKGAKGVTRPSGGSAAPAQATTAGKAAQSPGGVWGSDGAPPASIPIPEPAQQAPQPAPAQPPPQPVAAPEPEKVAAVPPPQVERPLALPGTLVVSCRPSAQVFLDGQSVGETPVLGLKRPSGTYKVRLSRPDLNFEKSVEVTIKPGGTTKVICNTDACDVVN